MTTSAPARPLAILIAALGGEGGGVLTSWIVNAASEAGFPVQSTSIPGVAQRTGATTYYIELFPVPRTELGAARPVLALSPGPGEVDLMVASELLEAGRAIAGGFVTPARTTLVASTSRVYAITERAAMGDGRFDMGRLFQAARESSKAAILFDMSVAAREADSALNAVLLGAIAGAGLLPLTPTQLEASIRAEGKSVETNLRGFRAGLAGARRERPDEPEPTPIHPCATTAETLHRQVERMAPAQAREVMIEGIARLVHYQDIAYAQRYLDRLARFAALDRQTDAGGALVREVARHLALWMSYEDVIRVAQAKADPARLHRLAADARVEGDQPYRVFDFFKPGIEELCSLLPPALARPILAFATRRGWLGKAYWGMEIETTSITGYLRVWLLSKLRFWRPRSHRFVEEQAAIENWLDLVAAAADRSLALALEVAECARLIKGYGDTHRGGIASFAAIETHLISPALAGRFAPAFAADAVASARTAALADPEGESLRRCLAEIEARAKPMAAAQ